MRLELSIVLHQVLFSCPPNRIIRSLLLTYGCLFFKAHINILKNCLLEQVFVNDLILPVFFDLVENVPPQLNHPGLEYLLSEEF